MESASTGKHRLLGTKAFCWDSPKPIKVSGVTPDKRCGSTTAMLAGMVYNANQIVML